MKKYLGEIVLAVGIVVLAGIIWFQQSPLNVKGASGPFNSVKQYLTVDADPYLNHALATSTQTNLVYVGTATTTYWFATDNADQVNFNLLGAMATSSTIQPFTNGDDVPTSNSVLGLAYCYEFGDATTTWFSPVSGCGFWKPITNGTSTINVAVTDVNSKYMRIRFSAPAATSTTFGLWAQAILKKSY